MISLRRKNRNMIKPMAIVVISFLALLYGCHGSNDDPPDPNTPITDGPRLGLVTSNTATIYWDTNSPAIGSVHYSQDQSYSQILSETSPTTAHRLTITGLSAETTYYYKVVTGDASSSGNPFTTATLRADAVFKFISMADNRGNSDQSDIISLPKPFLRIIQDATTRNAAFVMHAGDMFYGETPDINTVRALYASFKRATDPLAKGIPFLVSPGNHEMAPLNAQHPEPGYDPLAVFNEQLAQPAVLSGYEGTVYSWDWGNSHFVSIDTVHFKYQSSLGGQGMYYVSDEQISWLEADLTEAQKRGVRHIFVFGHVNAFAKSGWLELDYLAYVVGGSDEQNNLHQAQRDKFWNLLERYNIDAYICGHQHIFDDTAAQNGIGGSANNQVVQWVNGNSGSVPEGSGKNQYTLWTINGDTVTAQLIDDTGVVDYTRTFTSRQP